MSDYAKLCEELRRLSETNSMSFYKRQVCKEAADAIIVLQAAIEAIAGDCIELRTEVAQLKREQSTEYMRGLKYAIYEIMKEADIRGSQEIRDSGDSDDEMCAAVAAKIRYEIDAADAIEALQASAAEKDKRIAELEAEVAQPRTERDAAIADIPQECVTCLHSDDNGEPAEWQCAYCYKNMDDELISDHYCYEYRGDDRRNQS